MNGGTATTHLDRLIAAICDDDPRLRREQFDLVQTMLREGHRQPDPLAPPGSIQMPAVALTEQVWQCVNCLRDWPEPFCQECGHNLMERPS